MQPLDKAVDTIEKDSLEKKLKRPGLRIKLGIDPTGPRLHLGFASTIRRLRQFQDMGHHAVLIIGDFTAKIGDTSDKTAERQPLTDQEIQANMKDYQSQLGLVLDLKKTEIHYNSEWLAKLDLSELIKLAQQFTVAQMIERENFNLRFKEQRPIGLHELLYPLLQGYDSVAVKADIEIGAKDQLFNVLAGRTIQKFYGQAPQDIVTYDLLTGTDGRKMSKSWSNCIYIDEPPTEIYGKVMSIPDELILQYYRICTDVPDETVQALEKTLVAGANPRDAKASLAREIVGIYRGEKAALAAEEAWNKQFRDGQRPEDIPSAHTATGKRDLAELLVELGLAESKTAARRLVSQGGVKLNGAVLDAEASEIQLKNDDVLQVGKRHFVRIT